MNIKHFIKVLLSWITVRIKAGPLKGKKWIFTSGSKFLSGEYEDYKTRAFLNNFSKGDVLYDIGAHIGYYSSIASVINDGEGAVYAFEPRPMNAKFFRKHMKLNGFRNVTLYEAAVGESDTVVSFDARHGSATGHISETGNIKVSQVSLERMVRDRIIPVPGFIKIDVEGGEVMVIKSLEKIISSVRPKLIVATHTSGNHKFVVDFLNSNRYKLEVLNPGTQKGDTEIIALPV